MGFIEIFSNDASSSQPPSTLSEEDNGTQEIPASQSLDDIHNSLNSIKAYLSSSKLKGERTIEMDNNLLERHINDYSMLFSRLVTPFSYVNLADNNDLRNISKYITTMEWDKCKKYTEVVKRGIEEYSNLEIQTKARMIIHLLSIVELCENLSRSAKYITNHEMTIVDVQRLMRSFDIYQRNDINTCELGCNS